MRRSRLIPVFLATGLSSCICATSKALIESCTFKPGLNADSPARVYSLNGEQYAAVHIDYTCTGNQEAGFYMTSTPELGHAVEIPLGPERRRRETYYFELPANGGSARMIDKETGLTYAAMATPATGMQGPGISLHSGDAPSHYDKASNTLTISLPEKHGADAIIKYPLAAVLLIGVDIPCSLVGSLINFIIITADEISDE